MSRGNCHRGGVLHFSVVLDRSAPPSRHTTGGFDPFPLRGRSARPRAARPSARRANARPRRFGGAVRRECGRKCVRAHIRPSLAEALAGGQELGRARGKSEGGRSVRRRGGKWAKRPVVVYLAARLKEGSPCDEVPQGAGVSSRERATFKRSCHARPMDRTFAKALAEL